LLHYGHTKDLAASRGCSSRSRKSESYPRRGRDGAGMNGLVRGVKSPELWDTLAELLRQDGVLGANQKILVGVDQAQPFSPTVVIRSSEFRVDPDRFASVGLASLAAAALYWP